MSSNITTNWTTKLLRGYRFTSLLLLNTVLIFIFLNVLLLALFWLTDYLRTDQVSIKYGRKAIQEVYDQPNQSKLEQLLHETWSRTYVYEPYTQFKERAYTGQYVSVAENGYRLSRNQGPWPPQLYNLNIFIFGGSTTFGYGVADNQTIASYLQEYLTQQLHRSVSVYNFGRGYYYSTQELILFERLLTSGFIPDVAVFIDGLNEFYYSEDEPIFTKHLQKFVNDEGSVVSNWTFISKIPVIQFAQEVLRRLRNIFRSSSESQPLVDANVDDLFPESYNDPTLIESMINRYLSNKRIVEAISTVYGLKPMFVWQPVPVYCYDLDHRPFAQGGFGRHTYSKFGYELMSKQFENEGFGSNFLWCADIQRALDGHLYVDRFHYSPKLSRVLAEKIGDTMIEKHLFPNPKSQFKVELTALISSRKSVYQAGEVIVADFWGAEGNATDWIGLFPKSGDNNSYLAWVCTDNTHNGTAGIIDGIVTFWGPSSPGDYEVRLFFNGSRNVEATAQFSVGY